MAAAKTFFSTVYNIGTTCFGECYIPYDNSKTLYFTKD